MRLYPMNDTARVKDPEYGVFDVQDHGGFDLPDELSDKLQKVCVRGRRLWESEEERALRLHASEQERQRDPAALYGAVAELVKLAKEVRGDGPADDAGAKPRTRKTPAAAESAGATA